MNTTETVEKPKPVKVDVLPSLWRRLRQLALEHGHTVAEELTLAIAGHLYHEE
ncbi:MAG: hypothetical protein WAN65_13355 [Candidatus Sulfotelmatobacter sp.]